MIVTYNQEIDAIYFKLNNNKIVGSDEQTERIILDYDKDNNLVGIEILDFSYLKNKGLKPDDLPFNYEHKAIASEYFVKKELTDYQKICR